MLFSLRFSVQIFSLLTELNDDKLFDFGMKDRLFTFPSCFRKLNEGALGRLLSLLFPPIVSLKDDSFRRIELLMNFFFVIDSFIGVTELVYFFFVFIS